MPEAREGVVVQLCAFPLCDASRPTHAWRDNVVRGRGWFEQKNGDAWCSEHIPEWVDEWRRKRRGEAVRKTNVD